MMAIYIQIVKELEDAASVIYSFGPTEELIGKVLLSKITGETELIEIDSPSREPFYVSRVKRALKHHHDSGEYPDKTCYAA